MTIPCLPRALSGNFQSTPVTCNIHGSIFPRFAEAANIWRPLDLLPKAAHLAATAQPDNQSRFHYHLTGVARFLIINRFGARRLPMLSTPVLRVHGFCQFPPQGTSVFFFFQTTAFEFCRRLVMMCVPYCVWLFPPVNCSQWLHVQYVHGSPRHPCSRSAPG